MLPLVFYSQGKNRIARVLRTQISRKRAGRHLPRACWHRQLGSPNGNLMRRQWQGYVTGEFSKRRNINTLQILRWPNYVTLHTFCEPPHTFAILACITFPFPAVSEVGILVSLFRSVDCEARALRAVSECLTQGLMAFEAGGVNGVGRGEGNPATLDQLPNCPEKPGHFSTEAARFVWTVSGISIRYVDQPACLPHIPFP